MKLNNGISEMIIVLSHTWLWPAGSGFAGRICDSTKLPIEDPDWPMVIA